MIHFRFLISLFLSMYISLTSTDAPAADSDYIELLRKRTNAPLYDLSSGWIWEGQPQEINIPYIFPDSTQSATLTREFFIPDSLQKNPLRIWFLGIHGYVEIYVNGNLIRSHPDFKSAFMATIPMEYLYPRSKNVIEISLNRMQDRITGVPQFAQLYRQKSILAVAGEIFIEWQPEYRFDSFTYSSNGNNLTYTFEVKFLQSVLAESKRVRLQERVLSSDGRVIFTRYEYLVPENRSFKREITDREFRLWSPDFPNLYLVELRIITPKGKSYWRKFRIGLRTLSTASNSILLNGKNFNIKGITYREIYTGFNSFTDLRQKIVNDLTNIRAKNINALRIPHSIPHPFFSEICDSLGILLFIENWIWRFPNEYFSEDNLLRVTKMIGDESLEQFHLNPSLAGYCLGHEISVEDPAVHKFILILNEYLKQRFKFLSYISPLDEDEIASAPPLDIYFIVKYDQTVFSSIEKEKVRPVNPVPVLLANVGFASSDLPEAPERSKQWRYFSSLIKTQSYYNGYFIESFSDWPGNQFAPPIYGQTTNDDFFYTYGLFEADGTASEILDLLHEENSHITKSPEVKRQTNFFSLAVFISSILFFLIYRRNFRLRENIQRALTHPYGFFVDLRDRRIISISNSSIIALFTTLIVAIVLAAYVYYFRYNLLFDEYVSTIFNTTNLKSTYFSITDSPLGSCLFFWIFSYSLQVATAVIMKLFNIFSANKFRFRQSLAVSNWSGAPIIFLIPVSLLSLQIVAIESLRPVLFTVIILFIFWYHFRLIKGIRILFMRHNLPVIILVILTYGGLICTFIAFSGIEFSIFSYWLLLSRATSLL